MKVCIVIPCYNEEERINRNAFLTFLKQYSNFSFCFVNDGSVDKTLQVLNNLKTQSKQIIVLDNPKNMGKAATVRNGVNNIVNDFDIVGFLDADLATPLDELKILVKVLEENNYDAVFGSRVLKLGSDIQRRFKRHLFGRLFATTIGFLFGITAYDTQCGAKVFKQDLAKEIFDRAFVSKWIFDVELLLRAKNIKKQPSLYEQPLTKWVDVAGSKIGLKDTLKMPFEILRLYIAYK